MASQQHQPFETCVERKAYVNWSKTFVVWRRKNILRQLAAHDFFSLCAGICKILPSLGLIWFAPFFRLYLITCVERKAYVNWSKTFVVWRTTNHSA